MPEEGLGLVVAEEGGLEDVARHEALDGIGQQDGKGIRPAAQVHQVVIPAVVLKHVAWGRRMCKGGGDEHKSGLTIDSYVPHSEVTKMHHYH